ncbi:MAG: hypothetical protein ACYCQJ_15320 [Nitrososphaerales archaeon]
MSSPPANQRVTKFTDVLASVQSGIAQSQGSNALSYYIPIKDTESEAEASPAINIASGPYTFDTPWPSLADVGSFDIT